MDKKKEELGKLYALRAGLSVISQKNDDYNKSGNDYNRCQNYLNNNFEFKNENQVENSYNKTITNLEKNKNRAHSKVESLFRELRTAKADFRKVKAKSTIICIIGIILIALNGLGIILIVHGVDKYKDGKKEYNSVKKEYEDCVKNRNLTNASYEKGIAQAVQKKNYNYNELSQYKKAEEEMLPYLDDLKSQQVGIIKETTAIQKALIKEYSPMLDIRDWENLDLVIYYYETRRADSIKEALQLVDVERRNNELINSIQCASNEICRTIRSSVQVLGEVLVAGFNSLSAQLEAQRVQTMGALQQINQSISGVLTQQTLNNALLAKANVSSKQMVEQMKTLNNKIKSA